MMAQTIEREVRRCRTCKEVFTTLVDDVWGDVLYCTYCYNPGDIFAPKGSARAKAEAARKSGFKLERCVADFELRTCDGCNGTTIFDQERFGTDENGNDTVAYGCCDVNGKCLECKGGKRYYLVESSVRQKLVGRS